MPKSEVDDFFSNLPTEDKQDADIFDEKKEVKEPVAEPEKDEDEVDEEGKITRKNRAYRRLEEKYERERESAIALNERVRLLSEQVESIGRRSTTETKSGDMPAEWVALYGSSEDAEKAWKLQGTFLNKFKEEARDEAIREFERREEARLSEERQFESFIDSGLESLEDKYNVDLTSDAPKARKARREFLEMVQKLSPKDENGTITGYADFESTFEIYKAQKVETPDNSRRKEIASGTMTRPGSEVQNQPPTTPGFRGWMKDYNLKN